LKKAVGEMNFCCNPIKAYNFAVPNEAEPSYWKSWDFRRLTFAIGPIWT